MNFDEMKTSPNSGAVGGWPARSLRVGALMAAFFQADCAVLAADDAWTNPVGGLFSTNSNWSLNAVPGAGDTAVFNLLSTGYTVAFNADAVFDRVRLRNDVVTLDLGGHVVNLTTPDNEQGLHVGFQPGDASALTLTHGTLVTVSGGVYGPSNGGTTARLSITGSDAVWQITGDSPETQIGQGTGDESSVFVTNGARIVAPGTALLLGRNGGSGRLDIVGVGSLVEARIVYFGLLGHGEGNVLGGGKLIAPGGIVIATQSAAPSGILTVSGSGTRVETRGIVVSQGSVAGQAQLIVEEDARVEAIENLAIGRKGQGTFRFLLTFRGII